MELSLLKRNDMRELTKEEKFQIILENYQNDVYKICLHLTKNEKTAYDTAVAVFVEFYQKFESLEEVNLEEPSLDKMNDCTLKYLMGLILKRVKRGNKKI